jgi:hypothetical protein
MPSTTSKPRFARYFSLKMAILVGF